MYKFIIILLSMPLLLNAASTEHTALLVPTRNAQGVAVLALIPQGYQPPATGYAQSSSYANIDEEAAAYASRFDCTGTEGAKLDYEVGYRAYKGWLKFGGSNGENLQMANEDVIPPLYRAYQHTPPHPAAAHILAKVMNYKARHHGAAMAAGTLFVLPYVVLGTVFVGWWEPRFMPPVYFYDKEAEYYKTALNKCIEPHLRAEIEPKLKKAEYNVNCAKWTMRTAALGAVVGGAVIGAAAAHAI